MASIICEIACVYAVSIGFYVINFVNYDKHSILEKCIADSCTAYVCNIRFELYSLEFLAYHV